jgi:hypothetical protein
MRFVIPAFALSIGCGFNPSALTSNLPTSPTQSLEAKAKLPESSLPEVSAAALEPKVPEPDPPAYKDKDGKIHGPGGPISAEKRDCGPAHNHCLRGNGWFENGVDDRNETSTPRTPVFELDGHWYTWKGKPADGGTLYRTKPATAATLQSAREAYMFFQPRTDKATADSSLVYGALPASEKEALTVGRWGQIFPYKIDAAKGTILASDGLTYRIDAARVGFDPRATQ